MFVFASSIAANKLSDLINVSAPLIIAGAAAGLIGAMQFERQRGSLARGDGVGLARVAKSNLALAEFALASLLLGALVGAVAVVPLVKTRTLAIGDWSYTHSYEVGAFLVLEGLVIVGSVRRQSVLLSATFLLASLAGMSLVIVFAKPENAFTPTFVGWSIVGTVVSLIATQTPIMFAGVREFLTGKERLPQ